jgi:RNA polymerase sigma-70 factor (sigma-E family)
VEFEEYVRARGAALVRLAGLLTGQPQTAEDLTQEVLARAYVKWRRISGLDAPEAYLHRMLVNAAISRGRRRRAPEVPLSDAREPAATGCLSSETVERDAMWQLVRTLPPRQRAAVVLRFYEDLDDRAIADLLGCSPVTVRTQIMRALASLRERLHHTSELTIQGGTR